MKHFYLVGMSMLISLSFAMSSCKKEKNEDLANAKISIEIISAFDGNLTFTLSCDSEAAPSLYAYVAGERGVGMTASEIYEKGTKSDPKPQYTISGLDITKKYTLHVTAQISNKLIAPATIDFEAEEKPTDIPKAEFTLNMINPSATTIRIHSEFEETCARVYCNVIPISQLDPLLENPIETAIQLWNGGWIISREKLSPDSPIANQDDLLMDLTPETEYVLIATGINFDGVINDEIFVSEPIITKKMTFTGSEANVKITVAQSGKTQTTLRYQATEKTVAYYHAILEKDLPILSASEEEIIDYLLSEGNIWGWYGDNDPDWNPALEGMTWTWAGMEPGTDYVTIVCAQDTEGRISSVNRTSFSTLPLTPGKNPDFTFNVYDKTSNSFKFDITLNNDVAKVRYMIIQDELVCLDENSNEDVVSEILYENLLLSGIDEYESVKGMEVTKLPEASRHYICAIAYGESDIEKFKYDVIQFVNTNPALASSSVDFRKLEGGEEKTFSVRKELNRLIEKNEPAKDAAEKTKELFRIKK